METLVTLSKVQFTFIPFADFLLSEIWISDPDKDKYAGEIIIRLN